MLKKKNYFQRVGEFSLVQIRRLYYPTKDLFATSRVNDNNVHLSRKHEDNETEGSQVIASITIRVTYRKQVVSRWICHRTIYE